MKYDRIVVVDIYSGQQGVSSRIDVTGESFSYVNLNSQLDLVIYSTKIIQLITSDINLNRNSWRVRFSFSMRKDMDIFIRLLDSLEVLPNIEKISVNNFHSLDDFISYSNKPRANYCFLK